MKARLERLMRRYGQAVCLTERETGESAVVRAFLQPILKQREDLPVTATPLGPVSRQRWLYIGSGGHPVSPGDRAVCGGLHLVVQESQSIWWRDEILYCRAVLRREKEAWE